MKGEYLLFNLLVIAGPLSQSFDRRVRFVRRWRLAFAASLLTLIPFIVWDAMVVDRHWFFNPKYTLGFRAAGLPIEEWLFFITVPFACLFIWEIIITFRPPSPSKTAAYLNPAPLLLGSLAVLSFILGKEYTGMALASAVAVCLVDRALRLNLLADRRLYLFSLIVILLTLLFNSYLTARPVVLYDPSFQLNLRIGTIPVEDFVYGLCHNLLAVMVYERLKRVQQ